MPDQRRLAGAKEAGDGRTKVRSLLLDAVADRERCTIWIETCAAASRYQELQSLTTNTTNVWRQALREAIDLGVAEGHFTPKAPIGRVVDTLVGLIDGMMLEVAIQNADYTLEYINSLLLDLANGLLGTDYEAFQETKDVPGSMLFLEAETFDR